jgi:hypothetical protein
MYTLNFENPPYKERFPTQLHRWLEVFSSLMLIQKAYPDGIEISNSLILAQFASGILRDGDFVVSCLHSDTLDEPACLSPYRKGSTEYRVGHSGLDLLALGMFCAHRIFFSRPFLNSFLPQLLSGQLPVCQSPDSSTRPSPSVPSPSDNPSSLWPTLYTLHRSFLVGFGGIVDMMRSGACTLRRDRVGRSHAQAYL